ncbi:uncharacterized protein PRCAT00003892001 [Priceomyces carsonii]|uniref:uncharacterized protein n=1 Tax=Priceomyces carsonii TaxID=28549 RepID=UPI002ED8FF37|nr:unnamed protein product [Priceomyces carsonii]
MSEEGKTSVDQYGRKKWNVSLYEEEAKSKTKNKRQKTPVDILSAIDSNESSSYIAHRNKLLNELMASVKVENLINPLNLGVYGKNKRFGFFCPICDLSFRDNLALIDHFNSPEHISRARVIKGPLGGDAESEEIESGVRRATIEEVVATIQLLVKQQLREQGNTNEKSGFTERVEKRRKFEEKRAAKRREKRKRIKYSQASREEVPNAASEMESMIGIQGFGSTKR